MSERQFHKDLRMFLVQLSIYSYEGRDPFAKGLCADALASIPQWIPVDERLPDEGVRVLAWCEVAGPCVAYRGIETWGLEDGEPPSVKWLMFHEPAPVDFYRSRLWDRVVAWMPLPEPPEVK
jgi:hypothetical protein